MNSPGAPFDVGTLRGDGLELELIEFAEHPVHQVPTYQFRMIDPESGEELGRINLRIGSTEHIERYAGHVGYGVHEEHRGHGYAARALRLLLPLAARVGIDPLWITCDPENVASRKTLERAGADFVEIVDVPPDCIICKTGHPRKCRYRLWTT